MYFGTGPSSSSGAPKRMPPSKAVAVEEYVASLSRNGFLVAPPQEFLALLTDWRSPRAATNISPADRCGMRHMVGGTNIRLAGCIQCLLCGCACCMQRYCNWRSPRAATNISPADRWGHTAAGRSQATTSSTRLAG